MANSDFGQFPSEDYAYNYGPPAMGHGRGGHGGGGGGMPYGYGGGPHGGYGGPPMPGMQGMPPGYGGGPESMPSPLDAEIQVVCREIRQELATLDQSGEYGEQFKNGRRLLTTEVGKLENSIDPEWLEVDINKPIKVTKKILIPNFRHPRFNFVGKVLGPKGTTLQNIAKTYKCHVYILGRGSTRDRAKEQELLASGDPQFAHYGGPLHVKIETNAPPAVAYGRVASVIQVLTELLVPIKDTHIEGITTMQPDGIEVNKQEGGNDSAKEGNGGGGGEGGNSPDNENGGAGGGGMSQGGDRGGFGRGRGGGAWRGGGSMGGGGAPFRGGAFGGGRGGGGGGPRGGAPFRGGAGPRGSFRGAGGPMFGGGRGMPRPSFQPY